MDAVTLPRLPSLSIYAKSCWRRAKRVARSATHPPPTPPPVVTAVDLPSTPFASHTTVKPNENRSSRRREWRRGHFPGHRRFGSETACSPVAQYIQVFKQGSLEVGQSVGVDTRSEAVQPFANCRQNVFIGESRGSISIGGVAFCRN